MSDQVPTLHFGDSDDGVAVDLPKLIASRMLIQANSGGGKSWALRYMLEQTHGQVQQLMLDSEGEFASLRERFPYILAGTDGDLPATPKSAKLLCRRLVELGASAVLDIYDLSMPDRRRFVRLFLDELMHLPKKMSRPLLVVIDEAHRYAPETGKSEAAEVVQALCSQGRKRGFCAVLVTQRLSKLSKDAAAELLNRLIGRTHLDVDVRRAADDLGFDKEQRQELKSLRPGEFFVYGPAIGREVTLVRTGDVDTTHPEPGVVAPAPPPPPDAVQKLIGQLEDLEEEAAEEERTVEDLRAKVQRLEQELADAEADSPAPDPEDLERAREQGRAEARDEAAKVVGAHETHRRWLESKIAAALDDVAGVVETLRGDLERSGADELPSLEQPGDSSKVANRRRKSSYSRRDRRTESPPDPGNPGDRPAAQQRILDALATLETIGVDEVSRNNLAVFSSQSPKSSAYQAHVAKLEQAGLVRYPQAGHVQLTTEGRAVATPSVEIRTAEDLHEAWLSYLDGAQGRILEVLIDLYPDDVDRSELAELAGQSPRSSAYQAHVATLQQLGAVEYPGPGRVAATDLLFPEGLR